MVDAQHDEDHAVGRRLAVLARAARGGKLVRADNVLGAEVARAQPVAAAEDRRHFVQRDRRQSLAAGWPSSCTAFDSAVRMSRPSGLSPRQRFVGALQDDDVLLALERGHNRRLREGPNHIDVDGADA